MVHNLDKNDEFLRVYDELSDALFRRFYFKLSDRERATDLVQETFTKAWQYIREGKEVRNLKSFLYTIANHMIIDEYRKKKSVSLDALSESGFDPGEESQYKKMMLDIELGTVLQSIEKLPPKYHEVITMRYVDGLTPGKIAEITGETENVISVRLNRAIKKIQELLHIDLDE
ncbi:MAG: sigma-70 family RNA polymerase sigma factor [Candidatus Taylorbacteria bacterium]